MFNLTVAQAHTFYVGNNGWLVHNCDPLPFHPKQLSHIFRDAEGHVLDTPANRKMIQDVTRDLENFLGLDRYGNQWFAQIRSDGSQVWVKARNGKIINAGVNFPPRSYNPQTGLQVPIPPGGK